MVGLSVCLSPVLSSADNTGVQTSAAPQSPGEWSPITVLPIQGEQPYSGLAFDLGGSEKRKIELQLSEPLTLDIAKHLQSSSSGVGSVFLDSSLNLHLNDSLDITTSLGAGKSQATFQSLGSIHCQNGVLDQGSYRASDCYFINQANVLKQDQIALGLRYGNDSLSTSVNMFRNESSIGQQSVVNNAMPIAGPVLGDSPFSAAAMGSVFPGLGEGQSLNYMGSESSGLDMEFQVGFTMDSAGDLQLGLQLTRVLDASYQSISSYTPSLQSWTIANPFDSARVNLDWSKGNFSGGIQGFYREQIQFLNNEELDSSTTFDVHFTWRAPWNANLSVGTSNLLNTGGKDGIETDNSLKDPFESVYGRIPYVRYQQDL